MSTIAPSIDPCWHMRSVVHRIADGTLQGALRLYAKFHLSHCKRCKQALDVIKATLGKLRRLSEPAPVLPTERWASIESAWMEEEQRGPPQE